MGKDNTLKELEQIQKNAKKYVVRGDENKRDFDSSKIKNEFAYGSCYGNNLAWVDPAGGAVQNTWYNVTDSTMTDGQLNLVTHDGSGKLTIGVAGMYLINFAASVEVQTQNKHVEMGIELDGSGTAENDGIMHYHLPNVAAMADIEFCIASTMILSLNTGTTVEVAIRTTDTGTPILHVEHLSITVMKLGKDLQGMGSFITTQTSDLKKQKIMK